ncbi:MAG: redoxin domain-containing protein [Chloroflexi bacterium]|nr:redoxin domain-containing protein [Chloroflexota bacterium]
MPGPSVGVHAPDFTLPRAPAKRHTLSDYRGRQNVVVSFNALAFTGGPDWGVEGTLRNFERDATAFRASRTTILAITADSMYCNEAFSRALGGLSFPILADFLPRGAVCREWDCWSPDREHPRNVTVIVDRQGMVRYCAYHAQGGIPENEELLGVLDGLNA